MSKYKVLKMSKEGLEDAIKGLSEIRPSMENVVRMCNGMDKKQADFDAKQMEEHFNTAINAMITVLMMMDNMKGSKEEQ